MYDPDLGGFASDTAVALLESASDAAFAIDPGLTIVGWNGAACRLLGYAPEETLGKHCSDVLQSVYSHGEPLCVPSCEGLRCIRRFQTFAAPSCYVRHKDGGWVRVNLESVVMSGRARDSEGCSVAAVVFLRGGREKRDSSPSKSTLQISTFGRFGLAVGGDRLATEKWDRKQALTLLKFLVTHLGRAVHREVLIDCLWPDADEHSGRERLKVTVYALRRALRAAGMSEEVVETAGEAYILRREAVWIDADAFERSVADGFARQREEQWDEALQCYGEAERLFRGDYM